MGKVVVATGKDLIKTKVRINANLEEIDPITKQVINPADKPYIPTPEELAAAQNKTAETNTAPSNGLEEIIAKKLEEKISDAIGQAVGRMDIGGMIDKALDKALKK